VHRIGRTGRAGRSGTAITVVAPADGKAVAAIEKLIGQNIPWLVGVPARGPEASEETPKRHDGERGPRSADASADKPKRHDGERGPRGADISADKPKRHDDGERAPRRRHSTPRRDQPAPAPAPVARLEDARPRRGRQPSPHVEDDGVASHLPAFLLRPVRIKAKA
jgi:superfamily II DNA/RNA helicase